VTIPYPQRDLHVYHHDADGRPLPQITNAIDDPDRG
jgi:small conductance mechanosensitive channel